MAKGQVRVQTKGDGTYTIFDVLYVSRLKTNLLSVGQLQEEGYELNINNDNCKIEEAKLGLVTKVTLTNNRMFPLKFNHIEQSCLTAQLKEAAWLWHFWYGHLNFEGLKILQQKNMVIGLANFQKPSDLCEECVIGKKCRESFPRGRTQRASEVLQIVYSNICGPISPISNGGSRYFATFIDDYSRKT